MVLVRYRFRTRVELEMKFTTEFALQSQGTLLIENMPYTGVCKWQTGLSPSIVRFSKRLALVPPLAIHLEITIQNRRQRFTC